MAIPTPTYERQERRLVAYYKRAFREVLDALKSGAGGLERGQAEALLRQIEFLLRSLDQETRQWCEETVRQAFQDGQAAALLGLGEAATLTEAASAASFSLLAKDTVEALVNDTYADLLLATQNTERKVKAMVRNIVGKTMRLRAIQQQGRVSTTKALAEELSARGLSKTLDSEAWVGIVDKAGRRWDLTTYSQMVVRTKLNQAWVEGVKVETLERGVDLAQISSHNADDACRHFEGMVVSLHGLTPGFLTYDELRQSQLIWHPNCKHKVFPIRDFDLLNDQQKAKHEAKVKEARTALAATRRH